MWRKSSCGEDSWGYSDARSLAGSRKPCWVTQRRRTCQKVQEAAQRLQDQRGVARAGGVRQDLLQTAHRARAEGVQREEFEKDVDQLVVEDAVLGEVAENQVDGVQGVQEQRFHLRVHQHLRAELRERRGEEVR